MERLELNVSDTNSLERVVVDLLASDGDIYKLASELANSTDNDAGQIEPDDLAKFAEYLDEGTTYYTAELLYMAQYAMDGWLSLVR